MSSKHVDGGLADLLSLFLLLALGLVLAASGIIYLASLMGCGGAPFSVIRPSTTSDETLDAAENNADGGGQGEAESVHLPDAASSDAPLADANVLFLGDSNASSPDACLQAPPAMVKPPPQCQPTVIVVNTPEQYVRLQEITNDVPTCSYVATPAACISCESDFNCACLLMAQPVGKSCSCEIVDSMLPVVTCQ